MDSKTREAQEVIRTIQQYPYLGYDIHNLLDKAIDLLTVNPEPCEDARAFAKNIYMDVCERVEKDGYVAAGFIETYAEEIAAYASQVADKRAEELRGVVIETARFLKAHQDKSDGELYVIGRLEQTLAATEPKP